MIRVVSTGFAAPTRERCLASVRMQRGVEVEVEHVYIEASEQRPVRDVITNLWHAADIPPTDVIVWLDGDDWLISPDALALVETMHSSGAWVTWGSFEFSDGRSGFAAPLDWTKPVRAQPWVTTHLKTFRAGLIHRLRPEDIDWPSGSQAPWDMVVMFACVEMAGEARSMFCPKILSAYNYATSNEWRNGPGEERRLERIIRARPPYELLEAL